MKIAIIEGIKFNPMVEAILTPVTLEVFIQLTNEKVVIHELSTLDELTTRFGIERVEEDVWDVTGVKGRTCQIRLRENGDGYTFVHYTR